MLRVLSTDCSVPSWPPWPVAGRRGRAAEGDARAPRCRAASVLCTQPAVPFLWLSLMPPRRPGAAVPLGRAARPASIGASVRLPSNAEPPSWTLHSQPVQSRSPCPELRPRCPRHPHHTVQGLWLGRESLGRATPQQAGRQLPREPGCLGTAGWVSRGPRGSHVCPSRRLAAEVKAREEL